MPLLLALLSLPSAHAGETIHVGVPEPSGIDQDRSSGRIFVADDGGELWVLDSDFRRVDVFDLGGDLEGVAYLQRKDRLLVAAEGDEQLLLVDPDTGELLAELDIPRTFRGETILAAGGQGIETLTVVGSRIFVANQAFDDSDPEDGSVLVELALTAGGDLRVVDAHALPMIDVAGSAYLSQTQELLLVSDAEDTLYSLRLTTLDAVATGAPLTRQAFGAVDLPGTDQEGICLIEGQVIIAQDSGDLYDAGSLADLRGVGGLQR
jgi:hypothetical protein